MNRKCWVALAWCVLVVAQVSAKVGVGVRCWITHSGRRAVVASRAYYELSLKPGDSEQHILEISNPGDEVGSFKVYPNDAINSDAGTLVGGSEGETPSGPGTWITLESAQFQLAPEEKRRVAFRVEVPGDVLPGEHFAWVFVEPEVAPAPGSGVADAAPMESQMGLTLRQRIGVLVIIRVEGSDRYSSALRADAQGLGKVYDGGQIFFRLKIVNTGNALSKPSYRWRLVNPANSQVFAGQEADQTPGYICPGKSVLLNLPLTAGKVLPRGPYLLKLEVSDLRNPDVKADAAFPVSIP